MQKSLPITFVIDSGEKGKMDGVGGVGEVSDRRKEAQVWKVSGNATVEGARWKKCI